MPTCVLPFVKMPGSCNERLGPENKAHMAVCTLQQKVYWNEKMVKFLQLSP
jgi:hypothetical protein